MSEVERGGDVVVVSWCQEGFDVESLFLNAARKADMVSTTLQRGIASQLLKAFDQRPLAGWTDTTFIATNRSRVQLHTDTPVLRSTACLDSARQP